MNDIFRDFATVRLYSIKSANIYETYTKNIQENKSFGLTTSQVHYLLTAGGIFSLLALGFNNIRLVKQLEKNPVSQKRYRV